MVTVIASVWPERTVSGVMPVPVKTRMDCANCGRFVPDAHWAGPKSAVFT